MQENPYQTPTAHHDGRSPTVKSALRLLIGSVVVLLTLLGSVAIGIGLYLVLVPPAARQQGGNPLLVIVCVGVLPIASLLLVSRLLNWLFAKMRLS